MSTKMLSESLEGSGEWILDNFWKAQKSDRTGVNGTTIDEIGEKITSPGYNTADWLDGVVPGTVLATLVKNGIYLDPYFGKKNESSIIPDIYEAGRDFYTYWFYNSFKLPDITPGKKIWLHLRGINYHARLFLNGKIINREKVSGMFLRHQFDITENAVKEGENRLAVLVEPPDHPGHIPTVKTPGQGQGGDHQIARDVTAQFTEGWDWMIPIRDRNTGIWDQVSIRITGPVKINDPHIKTRVPGVRVPGIQQEVAFLSLSAEVENVSGSECSGILVYEVENVKGSQKVSLQPGEKKAVSFPETALKNPRLWWPNGYGSQEIYTIEINFLLDSETVSDNQRIRFGVREITSEIDKQNGGRIFKVNGQKIFIKGGNWIASDGMMRHSAKRYRDEIRMHAEMNMNMIRIWGGSIAERPEFYDACDEFGILVMQEFWMTGDCNGWFAGEYYWPDDHKLYIQCAADTVKMLRNHPSLCFWCGGNELNPPKLPPEDIENALKNDIIPNLDGTRLYIPSSLSEGIGPHDGPYGTQKPEYFFKRDSNAFNPEIGSVGTPVVESIRAMMPQEAAEDFPKSKSKNLNDVWDYHYNPTPHNPLEGVSKEIDLYGCPKSLEEFCLKAQLVNYVQYRSLIEGWNSQMWEWYTGVLIWKSQNPWTCLRGQMYDWYLDQTGGFFGVRHAAEPVHIQLNLNDNKVIAVNNLFHELTDVTARARVYDLEGIDVTPPNSKKSGSVPPVSTQEFFTLEIKSLEQGVYFVKLELTDAESRLLSENFYWVSTLPDSDFRDLNTLPKIDPVTVLEIVKGEKEYDLKLSVKNPEEKGIVFFMRLKLLKKGSGNRPDQRVLPAFYDDNYFSLLPKEEKVLHIRCNQRDSGDEEPELWIEGWNVDCRQIFPGK
jgi:mannosylglycoprotein endo-beta-mannosidase